MDGTSLRSFFFNDTATTEIYTLSLHDALPIFLRSISLSEDVRSKAGRGAELPKTAEHLPEQRKSVARYLLGLVAWEYADRKSTRLNSSHANISYAVFCLKKKTIALAASSLWM